MEQLCSVIKVNSMIAHAYILTTLEKKKKKKRRRGVSLPFLAQT